MGTFLGYGSLLWVQNELSTHAAVGQRLMLSNRKLGSPCTWAGVYFYLHWASVAVKLGGLSSDAQAGCLIPGTLGPAQLTLPTC